MRSFLQTIGSSMLLACAVLGVQADNAEGQLSGLDRIQTGDSVRVHPRRGLTVDASFDRWDTGDMVLRVEGLDGRWFVDVADLDELEIYAQRTERESFRHGAVIGAAAGLFAGAVAGLILHTVGITDDPDAPPSQIMSNTLTGAGIGVASGVIFGGFYAARHPGWGWISIALPVH